MTAPEILMDLDRLGVSLEARDGKLLYRPRSRVPADMIERMLAHKPDLMEILQPEATATTPAPVADEADPRADWIVRAGPDGRAMLIHPDHLDDEYLDPPDGCPTCGGMMFWWNPRGNRFCMKCDPATTAMRLQEQATQLRNGRVGCPIAAPKAGP